MRKVILATYSGPEGQGFENGKFYPLLVEENPSWLRRKLKGWNNDCKVIITLPEFWPFADWETFWGYWTERQV